MEYLLAKSELGPNDFGNTHVTRVLAHSRPHLNLDYLVAKSELGPSELGTMHVTRISHGETSLLAYDLDYLVAQSELSPSEFGTMHVTRISAHLIPGT